MYSPLQLHRHRKLLCALRYTVFEDSRLTMVQRNQRVDSLWAMRFLGRVQAVLHSEYKVSQQVPWESCRFRCSGGASGTGRDPSNITNSQLSRKETRATAGEQVKSRIYWLPTKRKPNAFQHNSALLTGAPNWNHQPRYTFPQCKVYKHRRHPWRA